MGTRQDLTGVRFPEGVSVGHWSDQVGQTGCTMILAPAGAVGGVDVRGGAPGTLGTDALRPGTVIDRVHAVLLTGGPANRWPAGLASPAQRRAERL